MVLAQIGDIGNMIRNILEEQIIKQITDLLESTLLSLGLSENLLPLVIRILIAGGLFALVLVISHFLINKIVKPVVPPSAPVSIPEVTKVEVGEKLSLTDLSKNALTLELNIANFALGEIEKYKDNLSEEEYLKIKGFYEEKVAKLRDRIEELREKEEIESLMREAEEIPITPSPTTIAGSKVIEVSELAETPIIEDMLKRINMIVQEFKKEEE